MHRGIDGMCLDADGNIVATAGWELGGPGGMIYVFSSTGRVLETHPIGANRPTNCCFGGPGLTTLYVTSTDGHFYRAETDRVGLGYLPIKDISGSANRSRNPGSLPGRVGLRRGICRGFRPEPGKTASGDFLPLNMRSLRE